jgi:uncharacterized Zn finger protein
MGYYAWKPYVPVAKRKKQAADKVAKMKKKGESVSPVVIEGRAIARTFWGKSWCENLERYSDYENRLPRGRTYVRNGSVIDLKIARSEICAMVSGSEIYTVRIAISALPQSKWKALCADCAGSVDSLVELLQGRFSKAVMERVCAPDKGLFPSPKEIKLSCSCPDWADMCKHVAAVLYGVGARLDASPELLFTLRDVNHAELVTRAGDGLQVPKAPASSKRVMNGGDLGSIFGLEMAESEVGAKTAPAKAPAKKKAVAKNAAPNKAVAAKTGAAKAAAKAAVAAKAPVKTKAPVKAKQPEPAPQTRQAGKPTAKAVTASKAAPVSTTPGKAKAVKRTTTAPTAKAPAKAAVKAARTEKRSTQR